MNKFFMLAAAALVAMAAHPKFASNQTCKECHPKIWEEYQTSMHANATIFKDPIHGAVWKKNPASKKGAYKCAKCHTPAADNLKELIAPNGIGPDPKNPTQNDAVACAYCHRIKAIKEDLKTNHNIIDPTPKKYFGARKDHIPSPFHKIDTSNPNFLNGNVCMGCHSHKRNKFGLNVCSTDTNREIENANCVSCHMPKVPGSVSTLKKRKTHAFHGFAGAHAHNDMLKKYVELEFLPHLEGFEVAVNSKIPHAFLLHPARMAFVKVKVLRDTKEVFEDTKPLVRVLGAGGKPTPPWLAREVVKDTMLKANEKRVFKYDTKLQKGDKVVVILGYRLVKPPLAKKLGIKEKFATEPIVFKKAVFTY
jgi:DNA-directed RNA polymerase subunit RPC12/RpoP